jgi:hypothetical protein
MKCSFKEVACLLLVVAVLVVGSWSELQNPEKSFTQSD